MSPHHVQIVSLAYRVLPSFRWCYHSPQQFMTQNHAMVTPSIKISSASTGFSIPCSSSCQYIISFTNLLLLFIYIFSNSTSTTQAIQISSINFNQELSVCYSSSSSARITQKQNSSNNKSRASHQSNSKWWLSHHHTRSESSQKPHRNPVSQSSSSSAVRATHHLQEK